MEDHNTLSPYLLSPFDALISISRILKAVSSYFYFSSFHLFPPTFCSRMPGRGGKVGLKAPKSNDPEPTSSKVESGRPFFHQLLSMQHFLILKISMSNHAQGIGRLQLGLQGQGRGREGPKIISHEFDDEVLA